MQRWRLIGLVATLAMVVVLPIYMFNQWGNQADQPRKDPVRFITSEGCRECHKKEYDLWRKSHHARAMAVADRKTVLGDFNDAVFEHQGVISRFYTKDGRFYVHTRGPDGKEGDFSITYTFGWYPLQQYLVPFPGGRLQCLPLAWDVNEKKWFHLYPDLDLDPNEWIYWTNQGQNWNSMCADCHSTNLEKKYDPEKDSYTTKWAEISVGCEACHGPGSQHAAWGKLPEVARRGADNGLLVPTAGISNRQQVELCAPCHSRRSMLGDYRHGQQDLLDTEVPRLLEQGLYFPDGQIRDEVYVYGSFVQSKMYANGVRCSDCHDPHSITLHAKGNALCLQCHRAAVYDSKTHHFHKKEGEAGEPIRDRDGRVLFKVGSGALCVECHMPGRLYMVNDYRPDHSIRIPRPDLSVRLGTPNGCNRCHVDKTDTWAADKTRKWYGTEDRFHFGTIFAAGRRGEPSAREMLVQLADDHLLSPMVRATALSLLARYQGDDVRGAFVTALADDDSLIRRTALLYLPQVAAEELTHLAGPLLEDPVKGVRIEAARALTRIPQDQLSKPLQKPFAAALAEFLAAARYSADFADSRLNIGILDEYQGDTAEAEKQFRKAVAINRDYYTARINLAVLYSRQGKNDLAEEELRKALEINPDLADVHYSLGLLLSEQKKYREAVGHLQQAAAAMENNARAYYNLGQLLAFLGRDQEAEEALEQTVIIEPENMGYLQALARFYLKQRNLTGVRHAAELIIAADPENRFGRELLKFIHEREGQRPLDHAR